MMKKNLLAAFVFGLLVLCLSISTVDASPDKWEKIVSAKTIVVGNCPEYPPFSFRNTDSKVEGFDSDFARALGKAMGLEVVMKDTAWEGLVAGMKKGDHDMVISCMSPEEATQASKSVTMSKPYLRLSEIIVTRTDVKDIAAKEDLAGKMIGVQANCTSEVAVDSLKTMGIVATDIRRYNRNAEALIDLKSGRTDAVVVGFAYAATKIKGNKDLKIVNDPVRSVDIVVVMDKGDDTLVKHINQAIDQIKANGEFDAVFQKWLAL